MENGYSDFRADTFDEIDGKMWVYAAAAPDRKCEVASLLNAYGNDTTDVEKASGGVVKIAEGCFKVFWF